MYPVDEFDMVLELRGVPQSSVGAPLPIVVSDERFLLLAYLVQDAPDDWDGTSVRVVTPSSADEPAALVEFDGYHAYMFGPPNDEAFSGHPLASRGLGPYGTYEIQNSSWIRQLERMNSVHHHHRPERYALLKHFVFSFHDSTFECIARGFTATWHGPLTNVVAEMHRRLTG